MKKTFIPRHFLSYLLLSILIIVTLVPFVMMGLSSFKQDYEILSMKPKILPADGFTLREYKTLFAYWPFHRNFMNSIIVTTFTTVGAVFLCALCGITFAKYTFPGKNWLFLIIMGSMMLPFVSIIVPTFTLVKALGGLNTYWALIVPALTPPFGIFLMRQYALSGIPDALIEAAYIDGSSHWNTMLRILFPIMKPGIVSLAILTFMGTWNDFLRPLILTTKSKMFTVTVALSILADPGQPDLGLVMAAATLSALPVLIIYIIFNKQMIGSILEGMGK